MKKRVYLLFFLFSLLIFSFNFIFQKKPGYMDADYYFLGGKLLAQNTLKAPFLWNYLDDPTGLPHPLFSYWKPLASIVTAIPMKVFGSFDFQIGRSIFILIASLITPLAVFLGYRITKNKFLSILVGLFVVFSGFYFKFITIPETIALYLLFGGIYFFMALTLIKSYPNHKSMVWLKTLMIGGVSGLMALTRVDGVLFLIFSIGLIAYLQINTNGIKKPSTIKLMRYVSLCFLGFILMMIPDYFINYLNFGSIFSPVGLKAIWINFYDDTFIYPASQLDFQYWLSTGWIEKIHNIWQAFLLNLGTLSAVQLNVFGIPLFVIGAWRYKKENWLRFFLLISLSLFLFMTVLFPLAGSRGGYLHAAASLQVVNWILIAAGFYEFLLWGIKKRNWQLTRSKIMFGSAIVLFSFVITASIYYQDVIGSEPKSLIWNQNYDKFAQVEDVIRQHSAGKNEIVMINNPVGFHYQTGQWAIMLPNSDQPQFEEIIEKYNVRYLVLDENIPIRMKSYVDFLYNITEIGKIPSFEITIYEVKNSR